MADILVGDVTHVVLGSSSSGPGRVTRAVQVTFPTNAGRLDYPTGGIPLTASKMGFPRGITSCRVVSRALVAGEANPTWIWDGNQTTPKLLGFETKTAAKQMSEMSTALNDKALILATPQVLVLEVEG